MDNQLKCAAQYKAEGVEAFKAGDVKKALFKFHLARMNTIQVVQGAAKVPQKQQQQQEQQHEEEEGSPAEDDEAPASPQSNKAPPPTPANAAQAGATARDTENQQALTPPDVSLPTPAPHAMQAPREGASEAQAMQDMMGGMMGQQCSAEEEARALEVFIPALNNLAMCQLQLGKYAEAATTASELLAVDPTNAKAWYRRGVAQIHRENFEDAIADLERVLLLTPGDPMAVEKIAQAKEARKAFDLKQKKAFAKMFA